jgi:hypothetical protein
MFDEALDEFDYIPQVFVIPIIQYITNSDSIDMKADLIIKFMDKIRSSSEIPAYPLSWMKKVDSEDAYILEILSSNSIDISLKDICE